MFGVHHSSISSGLHTFSMWEHYVTGALYLIIGVTAFATNGLAAIVLARQNTQPRRKYSMLIYFLLTSALVNIGFPLNSSSSIAGRWLFGNFGCHFYGFIGFVVGISHIWMLFAFCIERYIATCHREFYKRMPSIYYTLLIAAMYSVGTFWAVMPLLGWGEYGLEPTGTSCTISYINATDSFQSLIMSMVIVTYSFPIVVSCYAVSKAWTALGNMSDSEKEKDRDLLSEEQLTAMATIFIPIALVSWSGFAYVSIYSAITDGGTTLSHLSVTMAPLLSKSGVILYPLIILVAGIRSIPKAESKKP
ncbi:retinochrome-like isoform X1 [Octopus vulgaris]|uniref:Retinochrome-like isoform X1 n=2 Tax=Octopus TaxID=6643 RepID=A0AA36AXS7_OCTVU|nr:retinochrome-like isoform X1 [Octopus sinensis]CAI9724246.1 retinochrome-like isoform X1 [Octopus vulgaris]